VTAEQLRILVADDSDAFRARLAAEIGLRIMSSR
jgi:hypothetical protein